MTAAAIGAPDRNDYDGKVGLRSYCNPAESEQLRQFKWVIHDFSPFFGIFELAPGVAWSFPSSVYPDRR
jgi:hypothetical protein